MNNLRDKGFESGSAWYAYYKLSGKSIKGIRSEVNLHGPFLPNWLQKYRAVVDMRAAILEGLRHRGI